MDKRQRVKRIIKKGDRFNCWTVIREVRGKYHRRFLCVSDFGKEKEVDLCHLISGASKGHYSRGKYSPSFKHGLSKKRIYVIWQRMKARCYKKNDPAYLNYGGRGIKIEWDSFEKFLADMKEGYNEKMTIERIDVNGNYNKENCKWIPRSEQNKNKRNTRIIEYKGGKYKLWELCKKFNIRYYTLYSRLYKYGFSIEDALKRNNFRSTKNGLKVEKLKNSGFGR